MSEPVKALEPGGTRLAKCSDCDEQHEVTQLAWDMAMMFHRMLIERGEEGLSGVARCEPCRVAWEDSCRQELEDEHYRDVELFRRMRVGLAKIGAGEVDRMDIRQFIATLPAEFVTEHEAAIKSFRAHADERFTKRDKGRSAKGESFT